jgi:FkbM family methyltransferase
MKFFIQFFFKGLYYFIVDKTFRSFFFKVIIYGTQDKKPNKAIRLGKHNVSILHYKSFVWQYYEIYFKKYYNFPSLNPSPIIIDCGANLGLSIINFKEQFPNSKVYGFEADPEVYKILEKNIESNSINGVTLFNKAVWVKDEMISFMPDGVDGGKIESESHTSANNIEAMDLNTFLQQFEKIDFLKIDIEGAETKVIPHIESCFNKIDRLFVEFHSFKGKNQDINEVIGVLSKYFRLYIDNPSFRNEPFFPSKKTYAMDLQLNIFAFKD